MKLLLTGFEPFHTFKTNPSKEISLSLSNKQIGIFKVTSAILPVAIESTFSVFEKLSPEQYDFILMLGLASSRSCFSLEKIGYNYIQDIRIDNNGNDLTEKQFLSKDNLYNNLDLFGFNERLKDIGLPTEVSFYAGTYLCNFLLHKCLESYRVPSLFIHIPPDLKISPIALYSIDELKHITSEIIRNLSYFF